MATKKIRYAAKLLFEFQIKSEQSSLCIESIIHFHAPNPKEAIRHAKKRGRAMRGDRYKSADGTMVDYRFAGIVDIMDFPVSEPDEVWYEVHRRLMTEKNKKRLFPSDKKLLEKIR